MSARFRTSKVSRVSFTSEKFLHLLLFAIPFYCVSDVTTKTKQPLTSLLQVCSLVFASVWNKVIMIIIMIAIITVRIMIIIMIAIITVRIITIIVVLIVKSKVV